MQFNAVCGPAVSHRVTRVAAVSRPLHVFTCALPPVSRRSSGVSLMTHGSFLPWLSSLNTFTWPGTSASTSMVILLLLPNNVLQQKQAHSSALAAANSRRAATAMPNRLCTAQVFKSSHNSSRCGYKDCVHVLWWHYARLAGLPCLQRFTKAAMIAAAELLCPACTLLLGCFAA